MVVVPDGLIVHTTETHSGQNHDAQIVDESGLMLRWRASPVLSRYRLITDSAYPKKQHNCQLIHQTINGQQSGLPTLQLYDVLTPRTSGMGIQAGGDA